MAAADTNTVGRNRSRTHHALIILDMISDFRFPDGDRLLGPALAAAKNIAALRKRASRHRVPCIYVNDNCGHWNADRNEVIQRCLATPSRAADIAALLKPEPSDFFVMKPRHSAFFATPLHTLLNQLEAHTLILTGVTTHQCVLFTAVDAYMRDFKLVIPGDCVAAISKSDTTRALALFKGSLKAKIASGQTIRFDKESPTRRKTAAA